MNMKLKAPLVLASGSPRRKDLLEQVGFEFEVIQREVNEYFPDNLHPRAVAVLIAENKAKAYGDLSMKNIVITADTVVALDGKVLVKPADREDAIIMLTRLSGKNHSVITGITIFHNGKFQSFSEETKVKFRKLKDADIRYYVEKYKPYDKAGAYGIQEWIGMIGVEGIEGDFYNVMGLPVGRLYEELRNYE
jgi:septum formation protein